MAALSVGDIIAVAKFFSNTYDNIQNADTEFTTFKNAAMDLGSSLKHLADAFEEQQHIIENRGATPHARDGDVLTELHNIIGDFSLMQQETDAFLKKHRLCQKNGSRIISRKIVWKATGSMKSDLRELRCALLLHLARVQLVTQTLHAKVQSGIAQRQDLFNQELMQKFDDSMRRFSALPTMLSRSNSRTTASYGADGRQLVRTSPSPQEITAREIDEEFAWLDGNFAANLPLEHSRSMSKMVDVCIWWYLKGQGWTLETEPDLQRYIDLSKSYWLLRQVMALLEFRSLPTYSMWSQYIGSLSEKLANEFAAMRGIRLPSLNELRHFAQEKPDCFDLGFNTSWNGFRTQNPGSGANDPSIQVLNLNLPGYPLGERDRKVTVIQQDVTSPDVLTVEDVQTTRKESYINAASHIPANHRETFSINRNDAQLIPCYVWGNMNQVQPLTIKLHSGDRKKPSGFEFFNRKDMFNFQKTFTSFTVKSDIPRVEALKLKTGFFSETHYKTARVQIWFEDLGAEDQGDVPGPMSPSLTDDRSSMAPSSAFTGASRVSNWSHSSTIMPAQRIQKIESSQVVLYTTDDGGERQLIFFISLDRCKLDYNSCCGRSRKLNSRSQSNLTRIECCERAVLVGPSKYLTLDRLTQKPDRRTPLGIPLAESFLKHDRIAKDMPRPGVKHVQVKWLTIKFKDMEDKGRFVNSFDQLKRLKNIKISMQNEVLKQARQGEME